MRGHEWIVVRRQYDSRTKALTVTLRTTEDFIAEDFRRRLEEADAREDVFDELNPGDER